MIHLPTARIFQIRKYATLFALLIVTLAFSNTARSQGTYTGALEYAFPILRTVPPISSNQPANVQLAYLWLDQAFRQVKPGMIMDLYIDSLPYGDTLKFL